MGNSLVKTSRFKNPAYIGDPVNTVRIFNELEVDEICFLDIRATLEKGQPDFDLLQQISDECFCPMSYGGGITDADTAARVFSTGFEKIVLNSGAVRRPELISRIADRYGSQAVTAAIDVKKNLLGRYAVFTDSGTVKTGFDPVSWAQEMESRGAGEILLTAIDREGTWSGFDTALIRQVAGAVRIPVIAHGGAGNVAHIGEAIRSAGASAAALGSMVVYQKKGMGVLVNFPAATSVKKALSL